MSSQPSRTDFTDVAIIALAAGTGTRAGAGPPKQYRLLAGRPILPRTLEALADGAPGACILPVIDAGARTLFDESIRDLAPQARLALLPPATGGATRQASARLGLEAIQTLNIEAKIVLIHDTARPFASIKLIQDCIESARASGAAIPGLAVLDTIKQTDANLAVVATPERATLRAVQTPQGFSFLAILDAHRRAHAAGVENLTDDAAVAEWAGLTVHIFDGDARNMKITTMEDFARAGEQVLASLPDIRTGQGFDVHAFREGDHVWLGGVRVPHDRALEGHSDADVLMHAITDAIYGALADGDIGYWFPPSDPQWKGAASEVFLRHAAELVRARGGLIAHIDATVICEAPKVGPHRDSIRAWLAEILGLPAGRVAVKATTTERLGFTGRREGIAAMATATVRLPPGED